MENSDFGTLQRNRPCHWKVFYSGGLRTVGIPQLKGRLESPAESFQHFRPEISSPSLEYAGAEHYGE
jgi:hypothetical protein